MSVPDPLAAFAEPPTTSMTILEIRTDSVLDSDVWGGEFDTHLASRAVHLATIPGLFSQYPSFSTN
jgi:hypothetical protein